MLRINLALEQIRLCMELLCRVAARFDFSGLEEGFRLSKRGKGRLRFALLKQILIRAQTEHLQQANPLLGFRVITKQNTNPLVGR